VEFLKASIADLIILLFSSLQNSEGSGNYDGCDSCADPPPPIFTIFEGQNLTFSLYPSLLRLLAKNLQKQISFIGSMWRKSKKKNKKRAFKSPAMKRQWFFTKISKKRAKVGGFFAAAEALLICYE
jgi:hypothetical protein